MHSRTVRNYRVLSSSHPSSPSVQEPSTAACQWRVWLLRRARRRCRWATIKTVSQPIPWEKACSATVRWSLYSSGGRWATRQTSDTDTLRLPIMRRWRRLILVIPSRRYSLICSVVASRWVPSNITAIVSRRLLRVTPLPVVARHWRVMIFLRQWQVSAMVLSRIVRS